MIGILNFGYFQEYISLNWAMFLANCAKGYLWGFQSHSVTYRIVLMLGERSLKDASEYIIAIVFEIKTHLR